MQINWVDRFYGDKKYIDGYVGEWRLFTVYYDKRDNRSRLKRKPWSVHCNLPGIKLSTGYEKKEHAINAARSSLRFWLNKLHSNKKPGRAHLKSTGNIWKRRKTNSNQFADVVAQIGGSSYDKPY